MREHEVPTHVQAEDKVLLGFTFPQVVAMTAVCALSYGAYRYAPVGPSEVRMGIAVLLGLAGIAAVAGKIGGRRLPLVAADLLKYRLGARLYAGPPSELVRSEPPAPEQPVKSGPGPLQLMARRAGKTLRRLRPKRKGRERTDGRMPFRPIAGSASPRGRRLTRTTSTARTSIRRSRRASSRSWPPSLWRRRSPSPRRPLPTTTGGMRSTSRSRSRSKGGGSSSRDSPSPATGPPSPCGPPPPWTSGCGPSAGRRAAGCGSGGRPPWTRGSASTTSLPLHGPSPSFTFSWKDTLGQAGAVTFEHGQIPYPLPAIDGDLCDLRVVSLGWSPGVVEGAIASECVSTIEERVELQTVAGHASVTETALIDSEVTAIAGTLTVAGSGSQARASFVPGGETRFRLPVGAGEAVHAVSIEADLEASLSIPMPPLTRLTHHPARVEHVTKTVHLHRPGDSDSDSETATATCDDGATSSAAATAYAYAYVPSVTIAKQVTVDIQHPEHVKAETVVRSPIDGSRDDALALALALALSVGADDPFEVLVLPEPEPEDPPAEQTPADGGLSDWFHILGWEWPW